MNAIEVEDLLNNSIYSVANKTRKYLAPCFSAYEDTFTREIRKYSTFGTFIGDTTRQYSPYSVSFLINVERNKIKNFMESIVFFRRHESYVKDYLVGDLIYSKLHMLTLKVPDRHIESYEYFLQGAYSKMYNINEVKKYLNLSMKLSGKTHSLRHTAVQVLTKDEEMRQAIADHYKVPLQLVQELDGKPKSTEEIFNCNEEFDLTKIISNEYRNKKIQSAQSQ